jgi:hypothetical protein
MTDNNNREAPSGELTPRSEPMLTIRSSRPAKDAPEDDRAVIPQSEPMTSIPDDHRREIPGR